MITTIFKGGMALCLVATVPVGGGTSMWAQWGLAGAVVGYVLWRDHLREKRMSRMIDDNDKWIRDTLLAALDKTTKALDRVCQNKNNNRKEIKS